MSESAQGHREAAPETVRVAVLTISDTRTPETDTGGDVVEETMRGAGHEVVARGIVRDEAASIRAQLVDLLVRSDVDATAPEGADNPAVTAALEHVGMGRITRTTAHMVTTMPNRAT